MRYAKKAGIVMLVACAVLLYKATVIYADLVKANDPKAVAIGSINGVKFAIPYYYIYGPIQYEGQNIWDPKSPKITPMPDTKIDDFAIMVRLSNFEPQRTPHDRGEYLQDASKVLPDINEKWLSIGFSPSSKHWNKTDFKGAVLGGEENKRRGPFVRQKDKVAGLLHDDSTRGYKSIPGEWNPHQDFFYDEEYKRVISCETFRQVVKPFATFTDCHHEFIIPDLKIVVMAIYTKKDLPRWNEIEEETNKIIHSFIVKE